MHFRPQKQSSKTNVRKDIRITETFSCVDPSPWGSFHLTRAWCQTWWQLLCSCKGRVCMAVSKRLWLNHNTLVTTFATGPVFKLEEFSGNWWKLNHLPQRPWVNTITQLMLVPCTCLTFRQSNHSILEWSCEKAITRVRLWYNPTNIGDLGWRKWTKPYSRISGTMVRNNHWESFSQLVSFFLISALHIF